jgi:hypothetical protein
LDEEEEGVVEEKGSFGNLFHPFRCPHPGFQIRILTKKTDDQ